ncbi:MAG: hypothetical protein FJ076_07705 [Cyanobacteria bacterium K_DeepCast_35m_m1_288]|nr:hypothetical protein [Cyanobacteria bacterium K_DeepCast_35m_m1_288]
MRILENGPRNDTDLNPYEHELEAALLRDLKDVGCALVDFTYDGWLWRGTNLPGRCLADKFRQELWEDSVSGKLLEVSGLAVSWLFGILSGVLVISLSQG